MTDANSDAGRTVSVAEPGDEIRARNAAEAVAAEIGFDESERSDLGHVAVELATNLLDHTPGGTLAVRPVETDSRQGIRVTSIDSGPGIADVDAAFAVGESTAESLGHGLATVNQLMDAVEIRPCEGADGGTRVVADRWLRPPRRATEPCPYSIGAATSAIARDLPNGDTFVVRSWDETALVGVIDGLGHGPQAHAAAVRARNYVESHFDQPLASIFRGTERACKATRGVVMALVRFDWAAETVSVANVGNVEIRASGPEHSGFVVRRGVVGGNAPDPRVVTETWEPHYTMVLHSDGISTRWSWTDLDPLEDRSGSDVSNWLLQHYRKENDDATVVAVTGSVDD